MFGNRVKPLDLTNVVGGQQPPERMSRAESLIFEMSNR